LTRFPSLEFGHLSIQAGPSPQLSGSFRPKQGPGSNPALWGRQKEKGSLDCGKNVVECRLKYRTPEMGTPPRKPLGNLRLQNDMRESDTMPRTLVQRSRDPEEFSLMASKLDAIPNFPKNYFMHPNPPGLCTAASTLASWLNKLEPTMSMALCVEM